MWSVAVTLKMVMVKISIGDDQNGHYVRVGHIFVKACYSF